MENKDKNERTEKAKEAFANIWQKTSSAGKNVGKKAADGAKSIAEQTKKNIYDAQAKKYTIVTEKEFASEEFVMPIVVKIVNDSANRNFVTTDDAVGWIEKHDAVNVLHMYFNYASKCHIDFFPHIQIESVYCKYRFDESIFIDTNDIFKKTTDEKVAELENIAFCLGAKKCSVEIVESDSSSKGTSVGFKVGSSEVSLITDGGISKKKSNVIRGKTISHWDGNDMPKQPRLAWFEQNENIKNLIDMRFSDVNAIKSKTYELSGSSSFTMNKSIAGVIDTVLGIKGTASMLNKVNEEHNSVLIYEIEF